MGDFAARPNLSNPPCACTQTCCGRPDSSPGRNPGVRRRLSSPGHIRGVLRSLSVAEATTRMLSGRDRAALRGGHAFTHADMKRVAQQFPDGGVSPKPGPGMNGQAVQPELTGVATTFVDLPPARHDADCDTPLHATGCDRPGGPCRAGIPGLAHRAKERTGGCVPRRASCLREHAHRPAGRHGAAGVDGCGEALVVWCEWCQRNPQGRNGQWHPLRQATRQGAASIVASRSPLPPDGGRSRRPSPDSP